MARRNQILSNIHSVDVWMIDREDEAQIIDIQSKEILEGLRSGKFVR